MVIRKQSSDQRPLHWVASSKRDLLSFDEQVVHEIGYQLSLAQLGVSPPAAKPWKGEGAGVFEIVEDFNGDAYRAVYTVRFSKAVYVIHCFQKKSPSGIRTAKTDIDLIRARLALARKDYEEHYGSDS